MLIWTLEGAHEAIVVVPLPSLTLVSTLLLSRSAGKIRSSEQRMTDVSHNEQDAREHVFRVAGTQFQDHESFRSSSSCKFIQKA